MFAAENQTNLQQSPLLEQAINNNRFTSDQINILEKINKLIINSPEFSPSAILSLSNSELNEIRGELDGIIKELNSSTNLNDARIET